jgi:N-formylglutamate deformylase
MSLAPSPRVVVHVPHASLVIPDECRASFLLSAEELERELLAMTDRDTDALFALPPDNSATVRFPVSRLVVDPERFTDDAQERMAARGMGVVYTRTSDGRPLRRAPTASERAALLARYYEPHHAALTARVAAALDAHGACLVIDGHSFPSSPLPYEDDQRHDRPEVCVGTDDFHTPASLRDSAVLALERAGFRVAVDRPFAGALVPMAYHRRDPRVTALMIEVNRGLYMDERTGRRLPGFESVRERLGDALRPLCSPR